MNKYGLTYLLMNGSSLAFSIKSVPNDKQNKLPKSDFAPTNNFPHLK